MNDQPVLVDHDPICVTHQSVPAVLWNSAGCGFCADCISHPRWWDGGR